MLDESNDQIMGRLLNLSSIDKTLCKLLLGACIAIQDDETAEFLIKRLREHIAITDETSLMYDTEHYLSYVKDLVDLSEGFEQVRPVKMLHDKARDTYEVLLYNRDRLTEVLNGLKREDDMDAMRENYWKN